MKIRDIALLAAGVVVVLLVVDRCGRTDRVEWEQRVAQAQSAHEKTAQRLTSALVRERRRADSVEARARALTARDAEIDTLIQRVRVNTPSELDTVPAVVDRDTIIDRLVRSRDRWKRMYENEHAANRRLQRHLQEALADSDSLSAVLDDRPGPEPWWLPEVGVGPFAGWCARGPCAGAGITVSWEISL